MIEQDATNQTNTHNDKTFYHQSIFWRIDISKMMKDFLPDNFIKGEFFILIFKIRIGNINNFHKALRVFDFFHRSDCINYQCNRTKDTTNKNKIHFFPPCLEFCMILSNSG